MARRLCGLPQTVYIPLPETDVRGTVNRLLQEGQAGSRAHHHGHLFGLSRDVYDPRGEAANTVLEVQEKAGMANHPSQEGIVSDNSEAGMKMRHAEAALEYVYGALGDIENNYASAGISPSGETAMTLLIITKAVNDARAMIEEVYENSRKGTTDA